MHWRRKWQPTPVFLPGESQGWGSLVGCRLWGHTELDTLKQLSSSSSSRGHNGLPQWLRQQRIYLQCRKHRFDPWVGKIPWRREWLLTPIFLAGEFYGQCMQSHFSCVQLFVTLWTVYTARLLCPWDFPGRNTGVGSHSLLQGIFPTQGSNPNLLHCRQSLTTIYLNQIMFYQQGRKGEETLSYR